MKSLLPAAALFIASQSTMVSTLVWPGVPEIHSTTVAFSSRVAEAVESFETGASARLHKRLKINGNTLPPSVVKAALAYRDTLLRSALTVHFTVNENATLPAPADLTIRLSDHPEWIQPVMTANSLWYVISEKAIAFAPDSFLPADFPRSADAMTALETDPTYQLTVSGTPKTGFRIDDAAIARAVAGAFNNGKKTVNIPLTEQEGSLYVSTPDGVKRLSLLSTGRSNFADSAAGRAANVRKATNRHLNGTLLPAGATFSFNNTLKRSVGGDRGWADSLVIVNGQDLVQEPGGGICQSTTTVYRALLLAGLPVVVRANHSLYVDHYKDYGVGIDATVYAPQQDLKAVNDTGHDIIMLARTVGDDVFVDLYGVPDGRTVALDGPYFQKTAPAGVTFKGRSLFINEIGWKQTVQYADGRTEKNDIVSRYLALPRTLAAEFEVRRGKEELITVAH